MMTEERRLQLKEELSRIEDKRGRLTPEAVVAYAKSHPQSALNSWFTWDDRRAAQAYRLDQARELIRSVYVTIQTEDRGVVTVQLYKRDPEIEKDLQGYRSIMRIREEAEPSRLLLLS